MSPTTIRFLKVGMAYFVLGALLGTLLAVPATRDLLYKAPGAQWRLAHTHLNLAGFVIMIIFGIAYHILPRFAGKPLRSEAWAQAHFWIAALATAGMVIGFLVPAAAVLLWTGSVAQFAGIVLGVANLWLTIR
ncbi:MAG TPA: cbb3-type cytochrome c oxidase subunit I [Candidatus Limnocylindrales bacterium]|nr:cbb3-type cytochrome c oxidase subunit I [Candidatus Limnocylindrales bacterium]